MINKLILLTFTVLSVIGMSCQSEAQVPADLPSCENPKFDEKIIQTLRFTVPVISVEHLHQSAPDYLILDAREKEEYEVSRIPGALWVGYDDFELSRVQAIADGRPIAVYCSIGYRSEKVGELLKASGFESVYNVYGSIFEWANRGFQLEDARGEPVKRVHTYNRSWGRWVDERLVEKVY